MYIAEKRARKVYELLGVLHYLATIQPWHAVKGVMKFATSGYIVYNRRLCAIEYDVIKHVTFMSSSCWQTLTFSNATVVDKW